MELTKIFPRAMIMNFESFAKRCYKVLEIDTQSEYEDYYNIFFDKDCISFELIKQMVTKALTVALKPFEHYHGVNHDEILEYLHYDYNSLEVITIYKLIDNLLDQFTHTSQTSVIKRYDELYDKSYDITTGGKTKRIQKLRKESAKRHENHCVYLNFSGRERQVVKTKDVKYYNLLCDNTRIRDFLHSSRIKVNKQLIENFETVYCNIEKESGFDRFALYHQLEFDSKIDFFTHFAFRIYTLRINNKISESDIDCMLPKIGSLQKYQTYNCMEYTLLALAGHIDEAVKYVYETYYMGVNEILNGCTNYYRINSITFGLQKIHSEFKNNYNCLNDIGKWLRELDVITYAAGTFVANILANVYISHTLNSDKHFAHTDTHTERGCKKYNDAIFQSINCVAHSDDATLYFNEYLKKNRNSFDYHLILNMENAQSVAKYLNKLYLCG